ncbi:uncharacterized protein LOC111441775 [Cucurbita moschata]|uniref:Uncharacterized protein LOC111441775 n=1 Tax=Cucurbita moschata TaxID=3662 RepID=A0A6J1F8A3_CUCMO|nr:uncharacterized protein LOC111441775 [Cucurbita moschata]
MATAAAAFFCVALSLAAFFAVSPAAVSAISASPPVPPHRASQNMSSFFPSPVDGRSSPISAAPAPATALESGEFIGKRSGSNSVKLNHGISAFGLSICSVFSLRLFLNV